jgi:hypothetical protein
MSGTQQMMVDPQTRWMSYGQAAGQTLESIKAGSKQSGFIT